MSKKFVLLAVIAALSLCAFTNVEKSQARAGVKFGGAYMVAFGGVTNIKEIVNHTPYDVSAGKTDFAEIRLVTRNDVLESIPANGIWTGDMWVPWADNSDEFKNHFMTINIHIPHPTRSGEYSLKHFSVWQSGEYVRFNDAHTFVDNAPRVPGEARAGGERRLIISIKDNKPVFTFAKFKP